MYRRLFSVASPARAVLRTRSRTAAPRPVTASQKPAADAKPKQPTAAAPNAIPSQPETQQAQVAQESTNDSIRSVPELNKTVDPTLDERSMVETVHQLEEQDLVSNADWSTSFQGLGAAPFPEKVTDILLQPTKPEDVEITPDGLVYLPEIKYRRILNRAFGPGGWGIAPRTKTMVTKRKVTREYGLVCLGRLVSVSRGEMDFFNAEGVTTAMEGCKSNALMRCCKDLGIASELWDPVFIREFKAKYCDSKYFEKRRRFAWKRKDRQWEYPYV